VNLASGRRRQAPRARLLVLVAATTALLLGACGSNGPSSARSGSDQGVTARVGSITLSQARVPQPASPDVAVAYFTLANSGDQPDQLVSASSSVAGTAELMRDVTHGGASTMELVSNVTVPAHSQTQLRPGATHLMLEHLTRNLRVGDHVVLRLRFQHNGMLTVTVPVTSLTTGLMQPSPTMSSMPGM
jgi:periplasmic copper chaperone A